MTSLQIIAIFLIGAVIGLLAGRAMRFLDEEMPTNRAIKKRMQQHPQARLSPNRKRK